VGAQEVRWNKAGPQPADDYAFFYGHVKFWPPMDRLFCTQEIISAVKRVEFTSDMMSYIYNTKRPLVWYYCSECGCTNWR
jgi:hypothetical protein